MTARRGAVTMHGIVPELTGRQAEVRWTGPGLGEHTDEVLVELGGVQAEELEALRLGRGDRLVQTRPFRALLFVPGSRPELVPKAVATGADALVLDLEDAVAENAKAEAREFVAGAIGDVSGAGVFVRINDLSARRTGRTTLRPSYVPG